MYTNTCRRLRVQTAALVAFASSCQLCRVTSTRTAAGMVWCSHSAVTKFKLYV